ncbi:MAG: hypothetical protein JAZ16_07600 [Candidatus Thiodiazotropha taylori]|nr:hypothetical protein [Candidatus Thiodiazotropha taylori]
MILPKRFLQEECENVEQSLKEALRHQYGGNKSADFFEETSYRLSIIANQINKASDGDVKNLSEFSHQILGLSELIARIERSHLGEFSWPFTDEIMEIAEATCCGVDGNDKDFGPPIFAISAEGGLVYKIHREQEVIDLNCRRRIFNVVFPRTLKHHVLLHPILGHEIGHAASSVPSMDYELAEKVISEFESNNLEDTNSLQQWLDIRSQETGDGTELIDIDETLFAWNEELLCDLFGLLVIGPSFLPAIKSLLSSIDPTDISLGEEHPPNLSRYDLLYKAVDYLGWKSTSESSNNKEVISSFWGATTNDDVNIPKWAELVPREKVEIAVKNLQTILTPLGDSLYNRESVGNLDELINKIRAKIPPVIANLDEEGNPKLEETDFRSILYAGWIVWNEVSQTPKQHNGMTFLEVNKLCDRGILHAVATRKTILKNRPK